MGSTRAPYVIFINPTKAVGCAVMRLLFGALAQQIPSLPDALCLPAKVITLAERKSGGNYITERRDKQRLTVMMLVENLVFGCLGWNQPEFIVSAVIAGEQTAKGWKSACEVT